MFLVCFYRVNCQALATGLLLVVALPLHCVFQPAGGRIAHPFTCTAAFFEYKLVICVRTLKVAVRCLRTLCIIYVYFNWKSIFIMPHIVEHCLGSIIQHASHRLFSFTGVVSLDFFPDNSGLCSLVLATWAGSLNLTKACAIFSGAMIPQACPSHSLQFVRFRHIILVSEIVPHPPPPTHARTPQKHHVAAACLGLFRILWEGVQNVQACTGMSKEAPAFLLSYPKLLQKPGLLKKKKAVSWHLSSCKQKYGQCS